MPEGLLPLLTKSADEDEDTVLSFTPEIIQQDIEKGDLHMPDSNYYWNSYAHFGIHEVCFHDNLLSFLISFIYTLINRKCLKIT